MAGVSDLAWGNIRKFWLRQGKYPKKFLARAFSARRFSVSYFAGRRARKHAFVSASFWETLSRLPGVVKKVRSLSSTMSQTLGKRVEISVGGVEEALRFDDSHVLSGNSNFFERLVRWQSVETKLNFLVRLMKMCPKILLQGSYSYAFLADFQDI